MKIAIAQLNFHIADFEGNRAVILKSIEKAKQDKADLVVFPELAVCGSPPLDLLLQNDFYARCEASLKMIAESCGDIAAIVGSPTLNSQQGKKLFNSACFLKDGVVKTIINKSLLCSNEFFNEARYFEPGREFSVIPFKNMRIAITINEDLWDDPSTVHHSAEPGFFNTSPLEELMKQAPDLLIHISADPFSNKKDQVKKRVLSDSALRYRIPLIHVNQVGGQTGLIFEGGSIVFYPDGNLSHRLALFSEDYHVFDSGTLKTEPFIPFQVSNRTHVENLHDALILGIKDFFMKTGFSKAILEVSSDINAAVTLILAVKALGKENVRVLILPSQDSTDQSITDAVILAENMGTQFDVIPIHEISHQIDTALHPILGGLGHDNPSENSQSRVRSMVLSAIANKYGQLLLNTSDKSELALGIGILNGNISGDLSVLGDVYKSMVSELAQYLNDTNEFITKKMLLNTEKSVFKFFSGSPDEGYKFESVDKILQAYIENQLSTREIMQLGFPESQVKQIIQTVNRNEFKRTHAPTILRVSSKAFGIGRHFPLAAKY